MNGSAEDLVPRMEAVFAAWMAGKGGRKAQSAAAEDACCTDGDACVSKGGGAAHG